MANHADLERVLRDLHSLGVKRVRAGVVAEKLWPGARGKNSKGQVFPLAAGVAGRMLKACRAVREVSPREYEILGYRLSDRLELNMTNNTTRFLASIDEASKKQILESIADHYGISTEAAYAEVTAGGAEHLLDYMVEPLRSATSVLMQAHGLRGY